MSDYGTATCIRHEDGTVTVEHADDRIGLSRELLLAAEKPHLRDDGLFQLDTAGEYVYRYVDLHPMRAGWRYDVLIYERVTDPTGLCPSTGPADTEEGATTR